MNLEEFKKEILSQSYNITTEAGEQLTVIESSDVFDIIKRLALDDDLVDISRDNHNLMRSAFIITIDDEYCKWEYGFQPINSDDISIEEITNVIEEYFNTKMVYAKLVE